METADISPPEQRGTPKPSGDTSGRFPRSPRSFSDVAPEIDRRCPRGPSGTPFVPHVKQRQDGSRSTRVPPRRAEAGARPGEEVKHVRAVWTRVLADVLYERWRAESAGVETTSLLGAKNGNAPRRGGLPAREEVPE